ncbi:MAG TPA: vWA domain-containing protein [Aggregatilineaceae bacterium]|nr:vWA domain-containing protein [Aggregatilineaceae bacterium]
MHRLKFIVLVVVLAGLISRAYMPTSAAVPAVQTQNAGGLDVIFAIDMSGSMYNTSQSNGVDKGLILAEQVLQILNELAPTDPNNIRFEMTEFMMDWLGDFGDQQEDFDVYASVVTFGTTSETLVDWTSLTERSEALQVEPPPIPSGEANSNFVNLYTKLGEMMAARSELPQGEQPRTPIVFVITDGLPCDTKQPVGELGGVVYDSCYQKERTQPHFELAYNTAQNAGWLREANTYTFVVTPLQALQNAYFTENEYTTYWQKISPQGAEVLSNIYAVGPRVMDILLAESARGLGIPQETLAIKPFENRQMPPYQEAAEIWTVATEPPATSTAPTFAFNTGDLDISGNSLFLSTSGAYGHYRFDYPPPGIWSITPNPTVNFVAYAAYRPASATLKLAVNGQELVSPDGVMTPAVGQYAPVEVVYKLPDVMPYEDVNYPFDLKVTLNAAGTDYDLPMQREGNLWRGEFLPIVPGPHRVSARMTPMAGQTGDWDNLIVDPQFLDPAPAEIQVTNVDVVHDFGTKDQQAAKQAGKLYIAGTESVPFYIELHDEAGNQVPLPSGMTAKLLFDGAACPVSPMTLKPIENQFIVPGGLTFGAGDCTISYTLTLVSDQPPLSGSRDIFGADGSGDDNTLGAVNVRKTTVLYYGWSENGEQMDQPDQFEMNDHDRAPKLGEGSLINWPEDELKIEVMVGYHAGDDVAQPLIGRWPEYVGDNDVEPGQSGDTGGGLQSPARLAGPMIPFDLRVLNQDDKNVAPEYGIALVPSDRAGVYTATIKGLKAGTYTIEVELKENLPLHSDFAFAPDMAKQITATLVVKGNPWPERLNYSMIAGVAAMLALVGVRTLRYRLSHRNPLSGRITIYEQRANRQDWNEVWAFDFSKTKINTFDIPLDQLPLWRPPGDRHPSENGRRKRRIGYADR